MIIMIIIRMIILIRRIIRRPSGEEGASAFRCCLPIKKMRKARARACPGVRPGPAHVRPNRNPNSVIPLLEALKRRQGR